MKNHSTMPKRFPPSLLESLEARTFCLQKEIADTDSLRYHLRESVCLGIDVEGCRGIGEGITSIGLAILPPTDFLFKSFPSLPFSTQDFVEQYQIESYCFYVEVEVDENHILHFPLDPLLKQ